MDRQRAAAAADEAARALTDTTDPALAEITVRIAADSTGTRILDEPRVWCPGRLPCIGRPALRIAVPVVVVAADEKATQQVGEKVGEILATYCPVCQAMKADPRE